jgi:hypothetical protein
MWTLVFLWFLLQVAGGIANLALNERIIAELGLIPLPLHQRLRIHRRKYPESNVRAQWMAVAISEVALMIVAVVFVVSRWH